ncbi:hypothetical protein, partial [Microcystis sp. Msp_OC_L_20101000_S702]|uniref:hypothetical protein n=1 Tax=Microcystis sp. Msp_OC_L_20101000_S702 TaxID=2486218 RepID=UPI00257EE466
HDQARGLKTDRVPIIFIHKYFTQFIPGKQESYATTTESLPSCPLRNVTNYMGILRKVKGRIH